MSHATHDPRGDTILAGSFIFGSAPEPSSSDEGLPPSRVRFDLFLYRFYKIRQTMWIYTLEFEREFAAALKKAGVDPQEAIQFLLKNPDFIAELAGMASSRLYEARHPEVVAPPNDHSDHVSSARTPRRSRRGSHPFGPDWLGP
ncbi:MAG: hypothetical protein HY978_01180 [Candidatus Liptonbacteria bacterium]|nr:hypothetical protein [Candidatus Liptonbacteria bacterium]